MSALTPGAPDYQGIYGDIVAVLENARRAAARSINAPMTASGRRIVEFEQGGQDRAAYGETLLKRLSADLSARFGRGFSERNREQMRLFYQAWPAARILQTASGEMPPAQISQPPSAISVDLPALAKAFPLPWSASSNKVLADEVAKTRRELEARRVGAGGAAEGGE